MHLCFSITAHGFGHGAISTAVIQRIMADFPEINISVVTLLSKSYLQSRLSGLFDYFPVGHDFGMLMDSPIAVDVANSKAKYAHLFNHWQQAVDQEIALLSQIQPDCVISNISPITLEAAMQLNIPTASVAPFNWAQIYQRYCLDAQDAQTQAVYQCMQRIYKQVDYIYKPLPSVPEKGCNELHIGSINSQPLPQRQVLLDYLPAQTSSIALVALGGLPITLDLQAWPVIPGCHWLVDQPGQTLRSDMTQVTDLPLSFLQLLASCDLILTKPGYGTYCEVAAVAAQKNLRVLSLTRPDWPETPYLNGFLAARVPFVELSIEQLQGQSLATAIAQVNALPYPQEQTCEDGAQQMVNHLLAQLSAIANKVK